jgi:hypothetical protein
VHTASKSDRSDTSQLGQSSLTKTQHLVTKHCRSLSDVLSVQQRIDAFSGHICNVYNVCVCVCVCVCVMFVCVCIYYICTYVHMYVCVCVHTHKSTQTQNLLTLLGPVCSRCRRKELRQLRRSVGAHASPLPQPLTATPSTVPRNRLKVDDVSDPLQLSCWNRSIILKSQYQ